MTAAEWTALALSLQVAALATAGTAPLAIALGLWLARTESRLKTAVEAVAMAPLVLPPVVTGVLLLWLFGRAGPLGALLGPVGLFAPLTRSGAALAAGVVAFPLFVRAVRLGVEGVDPGLEQAARTLGASRWRTWRTVTLPLAGPGIATGALLAFARALGEFGATITFAGNVEGATRTLPLAVYTAVHTPDGGPVATRLVVLSLVAALGAIAASELLARRSRREAP